MFEHELKKGAAELLVMSLLDARPRHGYESELNQSNPAAGSSSECDPLYPLSPPGGARWIKGSWVEGAGERRRRFYRLTPDAAGPGAPA